MKGKYNRKIALGFLFALAALFMLSRLYFSKSIITLEDEVTKESIVSRSGWSKPIKPTIAKKPPSNEHSILPENHINHAESSSSNSEKHGLTGLKGGLVKVSNLENVSESIFAITGAAPQDYELGLDKGMTFNGGPSIYMGSKSNNPKAYGAAIHYVDAHPFREREIEFIGSLKTEGTDSYATLWLRVDGISDMLSIDIMDDRKILGRTDWTEYRISMFIPVEAERLAVGIILDGNGQVWGSNFRVQGVPLKIGEVPLKIDLVNSQ